MDASALLTRQGWLGRGHSLHPTGRGIKKPLLVSEKSNHLGVGKKQHDAHADQWWARAFESSLKDLNVGKDDVTGNMKVSKGGWGELDMMRKGGRRWVGNGGLYGGFVKGEGLTGTIAEVGQNSGDGGTGASVEGDRREKSVKRMETREKSQSRKRKRATAKESRNEDGTKTAANKANPVTIPVSRDDANRKKKKAVEIPAAVDGLISQHGIVENGPKGRQRREVMDTDRDQSPVNGHVLKLDDEDINLQPIDLRDKTSHIIKREKKRQKEERRARKRAAMTSK
ncbi:hypothetical protein MMC20_007576 [Loxospora ochrophaea]|nr:hypothetical protein [Loxospora ochrophaea]